MEKIKVLIADDHVLVREGLSSLIGGQPDIEVVGEASDGTEVVSMAAKERPDIVLMDITMPGSDGLAATQLIKQNNPDIKILILTMHEGDDFFFESLNSGASGYFIKGGSSSELIWALHVVFHGEVFLYPTMAKKLLSDYLQRKSIENEPEIYNDLTNREKEILKFIAEGYTNQEIANTLFLSLSTVLSHRSHIMSKLGLRRPMELYKFALKRGFVNLDT